MPLTNDYMGFSAGFQYKEGRGLTPPSHYTGLIRSDGEIGQIKKDSDQPIALTIRVRGPGSSRTIKYERSAEDGITTPKTPVAGKLRTTTNKRFE